MNTAEIEPGNCLALDSETVLHLPSGLLGFEQVKRFLLTPASEAPFLWMQAENNRELAFLVVSPFEIVPDYAPDIPQDEVRSLGIECPEDVLLLNIITLRPNGRATLNLKGPVVVNRFSRIARQVIIANSADYSLQHPLTNAE